MRVRVFSVSQRVHSYASMTPAMEGHVLPGPGSATLRRRSCFCWGWLVFVRLVLSGWGWGCSSFRVGLSGLLCCLCRSVALAVLVGLAVVSLSVCLWGWVGRARPAAVGVFLVALGWALTCFDPSLLSAGGGFLPDLS